MSKALSDFYKTFSGADAIAYIKFDGEKPLLYGAMTTVSYSIKRQVNPVEVLGRNKSRGFTKSVRYVAGTFIMTMINKHFINELRDKLIFLQDKETRDIKTDELPLFDLIIICSNEYGGSGSMTIKDITFADEGGVVSIQDILTETQHSYFARDVKPFTHFDSRTGGGIVESMYDRNVSSTLIDIGEGLKPLPPGNGDPLTDWCDYNGIKWSWNDSTKIATFNFPQGTVKWHPSEPNPIPGTTIKNERFYIVSEATLYKFLADGIGPALIDTDSSAHRPGNGERLTDWMDDQGLAWDWDPVTKTTRFFFKDKMVTWRPGDAWNVPGTKLQQ